jgi:GAF domain-containing protein
VTVDDRAVDLERENAELRRRLAEREAELAEALEQQTATAEVLQIINSSPGNLVPVFEAILEKAHRLCGAAKGALVTYDGEAFQLAATRGLSEAYARILGETRGLQHIVTGSPREQLLNGADLVISPGADSWLGPVGRAAQEMEGIVHSVLFVPLRRDGSLLGYITAYRMDTLGFSNKQIALLQNFAAQAVIAMENARLLGECVNAPTKWRS